jgi:hypothetical protein
VNSHGGPFWIDREYDREYASDGVSRYGAYVRQATFTPWTDDDQAVELAVFAWDQATGPVMAPGYLRRHRRILLARPARSDWDGSLLACVDLVISQPRPLSYLRSDDDRGVWRDWPVQGAIAGSERFYEPDSDELARDPYLLTSASLRFTVPCGDLPHPSAYPQLTYAFEVAVTVVVQELNRIVSPVLERVEEG